MSAFQLPFSICYAVAKVCLMFAEGAPQQVVLVQRGGDDQKRADHSLERLCVVRQRSTR